jgi:hypothetical protein
VCSTFCIHLAFNPPLLKRKQGKVGNQGLRTSLQWGQNLDPCPSLASCHHSFMTCVSFEGTLPLSSRKSWIHKESLLRQGKWETVSSFWNGALPPWDLKQKEPGYGRSHLPSQSPSGPMVLVSAASRFSVAALTCLCPPVL